MGKINLNSLNKIPNPIDFIAGFGDLLTKHDDNIMKWATLALAGAVLILGYAAYNRWM